MKRKHWLLAIALLAPVAAGVAGYFYLRPTPGPAEPEGPNWFVDVTDESGVNFIHDAGKLGTYWLPQINGSGVAVFDFDGDGKLDLYLLNLGGPDSQSTNRLYKNLGGGKYQDVTAGSGLGINGHNTGVIVGDIDNDGWPDVVVTQVYGVKLFRNNGNGTFTDATADSGLKNLQWATSANLFDYDRDGWLDLIVVNYVDYDSSTKCPGVAGGPEYCGPQIFPNAVSKLFHNLGSKGSQPRFQDATIPSGLAAAPGPGLGVYCADFDGDGWQDIFIANDLKPNHLWINQKNGTFLEEAFSRGIGVDSLGQAQSGMGVAIGDVDNDGLFDVYVTHLTSERNTLWAQGPKRGHFSDQTARVGLLGTAWRGTGWGTLMADFDRDGWLDIAAVNGKATRGTESPFAALGDHFQYYGERNQLFRNDGTGKFRDISLANRPFCGSPNMGRGLASGDLDGDGALDLVVTTIADRARIFHNTAPDRGHWLLIRAFDPRLKRDAYGAEVRVRAGERRWVRIVNPGDSFQSSSDPRVHVGMGGASQFDSIHIRWPDGRAEVFPGGAADRVLTLRRGEGREDDPTSGK